MILMHALDAPYDIPPLGIVRGDVMYHVLSDQSGHGGTAELLSFMRSCGGHDSWLQSPGTYREHYDVFGDWADRVRMAGAREATSHEVAQILTAKREAAEGTHLTVPTITSRQMHVVERMVEEIFAIAPEQTREMAGMHVASLARTMLGGTLRGRSIVVLAGSGKNGSAGLVAARHLLNAGARTRVIMAHKQRPPHAHPLTSLEAMGIVPELATETNIDNVDLIIDALLGTGIDGTPRGTVASLIIAVNESKCPVLAIDLPSGLDPNEDGPQTPCVRATTTLALGLPKRGLALESAQLLAGTIWLADIGIPRRLFKRVGIRLGTVFARSPLVRLQRAAIAGEEFDSAFSQFLVADGSWQA